MLKTQIIKNTWQCDSCGLETDREHNPYFRVDIVIQAVSTSPSCTVDLCDVCITQISVPIVMDYVQDALLQEKVILEAQLKES